MKEIQERIMTRYQSEIYDRFVGQRLSDNSVVPVSPDLRDKLRSIHSRLGNGRDPSVLAGMSLEELTRLKEDIDSLAAVRRTPGGVTQYSSLATKRDENTSSPSIRGVEQSKAREQLVTDNPKSTVGLSNSAVTLNLQKIIRAHHVHSAEVEELSSGADLASWESSTAPVSVASTIKLPIAILALEKMRKGELGTIRGVPEIVAEGEKGLGSNTSPHEALKSMLKDSSNTATNFLVYSMGGPEQVTKEFHRLGFTNTTFSDYLSLPGRPVSTKNKSTASDVNKALRLLYLDKTDEGRVGREALSESNSPYKIKGGEGDKWGGNSAVWGDSAVVKVNGKKYAITLYVQTKDGGRESKQHVERALNKIVYELGNIKS